VYWAGAGEKTLSQLSGDGDAELNGGSGDRAGERFNSWPISTISSIDLNLYKSGIPTGTAYVRVLAASDDSVIGTLDSIDVSTLSFGYTWYTFNATPVSVPAKEDIRFIIEYSDGNVSSYIATQIYGSDCYSGGVLTYTTSPPTFTDVAGSELTWRNLTYTSDEPPFPLDNSSCWGNLTNNSSFSVDISASMTNMVGGTTWTIGSSPGTNIFTIKIGIAGLAGVGNFTTLSSTPVAWITSMAAGNMTRWTMVFYTPTNSPQFADGTPKSGNMTFEAEAS
jgi:hypothetical protein